MPIPRNFLEEPDGSLSLDGLLDDDEFNSVSHPSRQDSFDHEFVSLATDEDTVFTTVDDLDEGFTEDATFTVVEEEPKPEPTPPPSRRSGNDDERGPLKPSKRRAKPEKRKRRKGEGDFLDEKKGKLLPFGSRKEKVGEFDERKNLKSKAFAVQVGVLTLLAATTGLGLYRVIVPPETYSVEEITAIAQQANGSTGFPVENGEQFARNFIQAYLSSSPSAQLDLSLYGAAFSSERQTSNDYSQSLVYGPELKQTKNFSASSAQYTFEVGLSGKTAEGASSVRWLAYAVNVYYDKGADSFSVVPGSPVAVPSTHVADTKSTPPGINLSDSGKDQEDQALADQVRNTVQQFFVEYTKASAESHEALLQYLIPDPPASLMTGLGGLVHIAGNNPDSAIEIKAWKTRQGVSVAATVQLETPGDSGSMISKSVYAITLKESNGKYLVAKVSPLGYIPAPTSE